MQHLIGKTNTEWLDQKQTQEEQIYLDVKPGQ